MKIKCIAETIQPQYHSKKIVDWVKKSELEITEGKVYVVLAISKYLDTIFYNILGDETENYPLAFPAELFEIIDNRISEYWSIDLEQIISLEDIEIENSDVISFKEWALNKDLFYENLLEGREPEMAFFNEYRDKMMIE